MYFLRTEKYLLAFFAHILQENPCSKKRSFVDPLEMLPKIPLEFIYSQILMRI
jgi:hypothetical protein